MAVDLPHYGLYFDRKENWDIEEVRRDLLAALPRLSPDRLDKALHADKRQYLLGGLTTEEKQAIDDLGLPGGRVRAGVQAGLSPRNHRQPSGGHRCARQHGLSGAELALNKTILGDAGKGPVPLSIDLRVQSVVDDEVAKAVNAYGAIGGVGIVTNVRTGEILAMTSYPFFDPNAPARPTPTSPASTSHAAATVYEPGSVFKVFTVAMGLDSGVATVNTCCSTCTPLVTLPGRKTPSTTSTRTSPSLPLSGIVHPLGPNIGAARLGLMAGADRMQHYFKDFGLFNAAPSELSESARPLYSHDLNQNTVASMAFGQAISVSPLALATGMGAVLNGGTNMCPSLSRSVAPTTYRRRAHRVISETTSRSMLDLMRLNATQGTGRTADLAAPGYRLGGKTGTAQKAIGGHYLKDMRVSSFAAVFPTDGPMNRDRYFVLILLDQAHAVPGTYGFATAAWNAGPAAGRVINRIAPLLGVERAPVPLALGQKSALTPDQINGGER